MDINEAVTDLPATPKDTIEVVSSTEEQATESVTEPVEKAAPPQETPEVQEQQRNARNQQRKAAKERLIRENAEVKERNRALEEQLSKLSKPTEAPKPKDLTQPPNITDYEDVLLYAEDMAEHKALKLLNDRDNKQAEQTLMEAEQNFMERANEWVSTKPEAKEQVEGFLEICKTRPDLKPITDGIKKSSMSVELIEYLDNSEADTNFLLHCRPEFVAPSLKKIENFLKQGGKPVQAEPKRQTQATPPIKPPGNNAKTDRSLSSYSQEDIENMPISEFKKLTKM